MGNNNGNNSNKVRRIAAATALTACLLVNSAGCAELDVNGVNPNTGNTTSTTDVAIDTVESKRIECKNSLVEHWYTEVITTKDGMPKYSIGSQYSIASLINYSFKEMDKAKTVSKVEEIYNDILNTVKSCVTFKKERANAREGLAEGELTPWERIKACVLKDGEAYYLYFDNALISDTNVKDAETVWFYAILPWDKDVATPFGTNYQQAYNNENCPYFARLTTLTTEISNFENFSVEINGKKYPEEFDAGKHNTLFYSTDELAFLEDFEVTYKPSSNVKTYGTING